MDLDEYLQFVAARIKEAQQKGDKEEVLRLIRVVQATLQDTATKLDAQPRLTLM